MYQIDYFTGLPCNFGATGLIEVEIEDCAIVIPNVFSPNGDGKNDRFRVSGLHNIEGVRMQVFNRWAPCFSRIWTRWQRRLDPRDDASEGTYYFILTFQSPPKN